MKNISLIIAVITLFVGCAPTTQPIVIDSSSGYFPKTSSLPFDAVKIEKEFIDIKYQPMLCFSGVKVKDQPKVISKSDDFFTTSFRQMNYFQKVVPLPSYYYPSDSVVDVNRFVEMLTVDVILQNKYQDTLGMLRATKNLANPDRRWESLAGAIYSNENWVKQNLPFLVVEVIIDPIGGLKVEYQVDLKAIDPETKDIVLFLRKRATIWASDEREFYVPLLNGFIDWVHHKKITVEKP